MILKGKPQPLNSVEQYLANRDWEILSTTNLKSAIAAIIKESPDYIFIAADHPNKKVKILPKLIIQAFGIRTIGFIESTSAQAMQALNELKLEYVLLPPVSGPAIERLIARIKKDQQRALDFANREKGLETEAETPENSEDETVAGPKEKKPGVMIFSSDKKEKGKAYVPTPGQAEPKPEKEATNSARKLLEQILSEENKTDSSDQIGAVRIAKGYADPEKPEGESNHDPYQAEWKSKKDRPLGQATDPEEGDYPEEPADESGEIQGSGKSKKKKTGSESSSRDHHNPVGYEEEDALQAEEEGDESFSAEEDSPEAKTHKKSTKKSAPRVRQVSDWKAPDPVTDSDSILVQGTQDALDNSIQRIEGLKEYEAVNQASNVTCIVVESPKFSGYLVAALGKDRAIDESFVEAVKSRLIEFLKKHGENVKDAESGMNLKLEEIDFQDWALDQAEFLRKSIHGSTEIAMAFFPNSDTQVRLEQSVNENMLQMDIEELESEIPVDFDMYIYMPTNNRYLLYTPQGRRIAKEQHGRLKDKGINKVHLRKESQNQVKKYRAQKFLNSKIQAYKTNKKTKAS